MKKFFALLTTLIITLSFCACGPKESGSMNVLVLSGPTGIGSVNLWQESENGTTENDYHFSTVSANDEVVAAISDGSADIAAIATNQSAALYNKTGGKIKVLAVNTTGVLSILTNGEELADFSSLKGKTIFLPGQGANPEYILRYVLKENGLDPDQDVNLQFVAEGSELPGVWAKDPEAVIMAPQPVATTILMKNKNAKKAFDMTEEWDKIAKDSKLMMGCVVARADFIEENADAVKTFLKEYEASIIKAKETPDSTGELCEKYGIVPKAAIAKKAIPDCGLTFVTGDEMRKGLSGYFNVMFEANPKSIGGKLPDEAFYY